MTHHISTEELDRIKDYVSQFDSQPSLYWGNKFKGRKMIYDNAMDQLHDMYLKRLHGKRLWIGVPSLPQYGQIIIHDSVLFDIREVIDNNYMSELRFSSDSGASGIVRIAWDNMTMHIDTTRGEAHSVDLTPDMFIINDFVITDVEYATHGEHIVNAVLDLTPATDDEIINADVALNTSTHTPMIRRGVLDQATMGGGLFPGRRVTLKAVSEATGVTQSTLSNLRNGKKDISNLSYTTLALLSYYGRIIDLERRLYYSEVKTPVIAETAPVGVSRPDVVVRMRDGVMYRCANYTELSSEEYYEDIIQLFSESGPMLSLHHVTIDGKTATYMSKLSVLKQDVVGIYIRDHIEVPDGDGP